MENFGRFKHLSQLLMLVEVQRLLFVVSLGVVGH